MRPDDRFREIDNAALYNANIALRICPNVRCGGDLFPVAYLENVLGCLDCKETFHVKAEE